MNIPIFDSHIHMDTRSANDYELMAICGVEAVLVPCTFTGQKKRSREAFLNHFDRLIAFEPNRAKAFGIDFYVAIAIHPGDVDDMKAAFEALESFPSLIGHPVVRAIGEITLKNHTPDELALFEQHILLSQQYHIPVIVEAPPGDNLEQLVKLSNALSGVIQKHRIDPSSIMMVDLNHEKLALVWDLNLGAYGIPVSPPLNGLFVIHRKVAPPEAKEILKTFGGDRVVFNSALHFGYGDPMCVARTLLHLTQMNVPADILEKVAYQNPRALLLRD